MPCALRRPSAFLRQYLGLTRVANPRCTARLPQPRRVIVRLGAMPGHILSLCFRAALAAHVPWPPALLATRSAMPCFTCGDVGGRCLRHVLGCLALLASLAAPRASCGSSTDAFPTLAGAVCARGCGAWHWPWGMRVLAWHDAADHAIDASTCEARKQRMCHRSCPLQSLLRRRPRGGRSLCFMIGAASLLASLCKTGQEELVNT